MNEDYFHTDLYAVYHKAYELQLPVRFITLFRNKVVSLIDFLRDKSFENLPALVSVSESIFLLLETDDLYYFIYYCYQKQLNNETILPINYSQEGLFNLFRKKKMFSEHLFPNQYTNWYSNFKLTIDFEKEIFLEKVRFIQILNATRQNPKIQVSEFTRSSFRALYKGIFNRLSSERHHAGIANFDDNTSSQSSIEDLLLRYPKSEELNEDNGIDIFADSVCTNMLPMIRYIDNTGEIKTKVYFSDDQYQKVLYSYVSSKIENSARNVIYFTIYSLKNLDWNKVDKDSFQIGTIYLETNTIEILSRAEGKQQKKSKKDYISKDEILARILESFPSMHVTMNSMGKIAGSFHMRIPNTLNLVFYQCVKCQNETLIKYDSCLRCGNTEFLLTPYVEFTNAGLGIEMSSFLTFILAANPIGKYFLFAEESSSSTTEKLRKTLNYRKLLGREYENLATGSREMFENKASTNVSFNILNVAGQDVVKKDLILSGQAVRITDSDTLITIEITNAVSELSLQEFLRFFPCIVQHWRDYHIKLSYEAFRMMPETIRYMRLKQEFLRLENPVAPPVHQVAIETKAIGVELKDIPEDAVDVLRHVEFDSYGNIITMPQFTPTNAQEKKLAEEADKTSEVDRVYPNDGYAYNIPGRKNYIEFPLFSGTYYISAETKLISISGGQNMEIRMKSVYTEKYKTYGLPGANASIEKYLNLYRGAIFDAKATLKIIPKLSAKIGKSGEMTPLPIGISSLLNSYSKSLYRMRYISTNSPNSFIDCICGAICDPCYAGTEEVEVPSSAPDIFDPLNNNIIDTFDNLGNPIEKRVNTSSLRILYTKLIRYRMATELNLEVLRQEFPNIKLDVIRQKLLDLDTYFPANMYYRLAEEFFNVNIYLFSYAPILAVPTVSKVREAKSTVEDGFMCIPDHTSIAVRTYRPYRNTICVLLNNNNLTREIQCELIVETIPTIDLQIRTLFDHRMNRLCYTKYITLVSSISWNYTTSREIYTTDANLTGKSILDLFNDFSPVSQYIDETGKMRRINFTHVSSNVCPMNILNPNNKSISNPQMMFTVCVPGFQPENLPFNSDVYLVDSSFIDALMVNSPVGRTVDGKNLTTGLWFASDSVKFAFYFPVIPVDKYQLLPIGPEQFYASNNNSSIATLVKIQRKANIFSNILKYLFNIYRKTLIAGYDDSYRNSIQLDVAFVKRGGRPMPRVNQNAKKAFNRGERAGIQITNESIIKDFTDSYFQLLSSDMNSDLYYDFSQVQRRFPEASSVEEAIAAFEKVAPQAFHRGKILILNEKLYELFTNLLSNLFTQYSDDAETPVYLTKYYFSEGDYLSTPNNIVFLNEFLYSRWYKSVTAGIQYAKRIHTTIQYFSNFDTYIYAMKLANGRERHYIIQRVNNDNDYTALAVALIWKRDHINVGHIVPKEYISLTLNPPELPNFLIWGISTSLEIVPYIDARSDRTEDFVEILYFGKFTNGSEKRYAAMLPLD